MYRNTLPGKFVVFEGLDGSGQSTQVRLLAEYLNGGGRTVLTTKEPTSTTEAGKQIIDILTHKKIVSSEELQKLFAEDRKEHLETVIIPALTEGTHVISDRYFLSSLAFGSIDCDINWLKELNNSFMLPNMTIILKVRAEVSLQRIIGRGKEIELFERKEKLEKVAVAYDTLAKQYDNCVVVNGEGILQDVHKVVKENTDQLFNLFHERTI